MNAVGVAVTVDVNESHGSLDRRPRVLPQRLAFEHVLINPLQRLPEIQKPHLLPMLLFCMVDQFNDLLRLNPAVRVEAQGVNALLDDGAVDGGFHVFDGLGIVFALQVLGFPVAGGAGGELPDHVADGVGVGVVFDGVDVAGELGVFGESFAGITFVIFFEDEFTRQGGVVTGEDLKDRGIDREKISLGSGLVHHLGKEARADGVHRITARHAKGDGAFVVGDLVEQIDAAVVGLLGAADVSRRRSTSAQTRAWMRDGVHLETQAFFEPGLKLRMFGIDGVGEDGERGFALRVFDLLETIENRAKVALVSDRIAHVIDGKNDDGFDAFFANPLRRGELRKILVRVVGVDLIEIGKAVAAGVGRVGGAHALR